jgi:surfeit locus 1 family protein
MKKQRRIDTEIPSPTRFHLPNVTTFFARQWWWSTLLVLVGVAVLARLGTWQLDRLEQRRTYNSGIIERLALPPLDLTTSSLPADTADLKNRQAIVRGKYDVSRQVALTQQNWMDSPGFHLITPLVFENGILSEGGRPAAILVDRGWLPAAELTAQNWSEFDISESITVTGYIKLSQTRPGSDSISQAANAPQTEWYRVDVAAIGAQLPYELLPIYLQEAPHPEGKTDLPLRSALDSDLSEGNHLSYAIQWFIFATILGGGYIYYVGTRTHEAV